MIPLWCKDEPGARDGPASSVTCRGSTLHEWLGYVGDSAHTHHLAATSSTQHTPDRLIGHAVIMGNLPQCFPLLNTLEHGSPF